MEAPRGGWLLALLIPALAGCTVSPAPEVPAALDRATLELPPLVEVVADPEGDARDWGGEYLRGWVRCGYLGQQAVDACRQAGFYEARDQVLTRDRGVPAPPATDVLGASFTDTPEHLVVELTLASLESSYEGAVTDDGRGVYWHVCWNDEEECVELQVERVAGQLSFEPYYDNHTGACDDWYWCPRAVPYEVAFGTPATIRWWVPRVLVGTPEEGSELRNVTAFTHRRAGPPAGAGAGFSGPASEYRGVSARSSYRADGTEDQGAYVLRTPRASFDPASARLPRSEDPAGDIMGDTARADLDVLALEVVESPRELAFLVEAATVDEAPADHHLHLALGLPSRRVFDFGYEALGGQRHPYGGYCSDENCTQWVTYPVGISVEPGSPGRLRVTVAREDLGGPARGDIPNILYAELDGERPTVATPSVAGVRASADAGSSPRDWIPPVQVFALQLDSEAPLSGDSRAPVLVDPEGDARLGFAPVGGGHEEQFDLTFLEARGAGPGESVLTVGIKDLSRVLVPSGYRALLYAAAVQTEQGSTMAGYYKDEDGRQEFFCAQDTAVLVEEQGDPSEVVWKPIEGLISVSTTPRSDRPREPQGTGDTGSVTFFVPHACFGSDTPETLAARRMGAGTYLVPSVPALGSPLETVDDASTESDIPLGQASVPVAAPAWYVAPFGLENFWDMLGLLAAGAVSMTGLALVQRKRSTLHRHLHEVDRATQAHARDAKALERELNDIRAEAKQDLMKGRLGDGQFVILEKRIDEHLNKVKVDVLAAAVEELPRRLAEEFRHAFPGRETRPRGRKGP